MKDLQDLRDQIDAINNELLQLLKKRFELSEQISNIKTKEDLPFKDSDRESIMLQTIESSLKEHKAGPEILTIFKKIFEQSLKHMAK